MKSPGFNGINRIVHAKIPQGKEQMKRFSFRRILIYSLLGLVVLCIGAIIVSALSNLNLPSRSLTVDRLDDLQKARLAEAAHLRQALGDQVWPGWGQADFPVIVYNEQYAFLVGYPNPPAGWVKIPKNEHRGASWELVPGNTFYGQIYYRQSLPDPLVTPENFIVLVGDRLVITLQTRESLEISFYTGFPKQVPSFLRAVIPYRVVWGFLEGETDQYIGGLEHEAFHAFEGIKAFDRLAAAENSVRQDSSYPWDDNAMESAWQAELNLLANAVQAKTDAETKQLAIQFLAQRDARRSASNLGESYIDYERQREWEEGLAKYAELSIGRLAGTSPDYQPLPVMASDPAFKSYKNQERFWSQQMGEIRRTSGRKGDTRFYYSGMAQAVLLDRFAPGWKDNFFSSQDSLESLLRVAVQ
jgi:hypothetical protein